jgi:hypothetical protein
MASNRSNATKRAAKAAVSAETPQGAMKAVAHQTVRVQIAALTAAGRAIAGWASAADRLAQAVGDELLRRVDGETDSGELIVRVATATNTHLHELAALPSTAADHFDTRLSRASIDN